MIIDAQVHAYERWDPSSLAAHVPGFGPPEVDGEQMVAAMDAVGVDAAVLVSPWAVYRSDTTFAESVYGDFPHRFRLVAPIDPSAQDVADRMAQWAATPGAVGVRLLHLPGIEWEPGDAGVAATAYGAESGRLPVNVQCWGRIPLMDDLARRYPGTRFVVDHLGLTQPLSPPAPAHALADLPHVLALARYPNVAIKLTGVGTYSRRPFPYDDLWEPIGRVVDAFGVDRCMWGTDWTRALDVLSYEEGVASFRDHWPLSSSDRDALMGGTARRVYDWTRWPS